VTSPMRVLIDTGIISSADFLVGDSRVQEFRWGNGSARTTIAGFRRIEPSRDPDQQREKDALFTLGRLSREGLVELSTYAELNAELWRRPKGRDPLLNAFLKCHIQCCSAPLERSKFRSTIDMTEWIAKGGKAEREKGVLPSEFNQIPYFQWLANLSKEEIATLELHAAKIGLDGFEVSSLHDLPWFQALARALVSPENLPDCFHMWTARRNGMDTLLTLEKKLPRTMNQLKQRKQDAIDAGVSILRPTQLLLQLGVTNIDSVPVQPERFYSYMEIIQIQERLVQERFRMETDDLKGTDTRCDSMESVDDGNRLAEDHDEDAWHSWHFFWRIRGRDCCGGNREEQWLQTGMLYPTLFWLKRAG
jgi:hypothetical protein